MHAIIQKATNVLTCEHLGLLILWRCFTAQKYDLVIIIIVQLIVMVRILKKTDVQRCRQESHLNVLKPTYSTHTHS